MKIMFMPHNAYHTYNMSLIVPYLEKYKAEYLFVNIDKVYKNEGAEREIRRCGLEYVDYKPGILWKVNPHVLVVMNDWGSVVKKKVLEANKMGIPTVALIEGVQDFEDTHVKHINAWKIRNPYKTVTYPFLIGEYDRKFITTDKAKVVGMPRIESLCREPTLPPAKPLVAINSNFTYGVYTNKQKMWIDSAVEACGILNLDYIITRHHADKMDFTGYNISDETMHEVIRKSSVLVSRFSTAILESMALGKPVVYHNPHGELVDTFQNPMEAFKKTTDVKSLCKALEESMRIDKDYRDVCNKFFDHHVSIKDKPSAERIADEILNLPMPQKRKNNKNIIRRLFAVFSERISRGWQRRVSTF